MVPVRLTSVFGRPLTRWSRIDPFAELDRMAGSVFGSVISDRPVQGFRVDVREDDDNYFVDADVPGLAKSDITVTFEAGVLTIAGERTVEENREDSNYVLSERRTGRFSRTLRMPDGVSESGIEAALNDGVLTVTLPKADEVKQRRIEVKN